MNQSNKFLFSETCISILLFLIIIWVVLLWLLQYLFGETKFEKIPKRQLFNHYNLDKKTMGKWVQYFCKDCIDVNKYKQQRKLDVVDYFYITATLGDPDEFPIYTKQRIIDECEGTYTSLRNSIDAYPDKFGITGETFRRLHKFPPNISQQIIQQYN